MEPLGHPRLSYCQSTVRLTVVHANFVYNHKVGYFPPFLGFIFSQVCFYFGSVLTLQLTARQYYTPIYHLFKALAPCHRLLLLILLPEVAMMVYCHPIVCDFHSRWPSLWGQGVLICQVALLTSHFILIVVGLLMLPLCKPDSLFMSTRLSSPVILARVVLPSPTDPSFERLPLSSQCSCVIGLNLQDNRNLPSLVHWNRLLWTKKLLRWLCHFLLDFF